MSFVSKSFSLNRGGAHTLMALTLAAICLSPSSAFAATITESFTGIVTSSSGSNATLNLFGGGSLVGQAATVSYSFENTGAYIAQSIVNGGDQQRIYALAPGNRVNLDITIGGNTISLGAAGDGGFSYRQNNGLGVGSCNGTFTICATGGLPSTMFYNPSGTLDYDGFLSQSVNDSFAAGVTQISMNFNSAFTVNVGNVTSNVVPEPSTVVLMFGSLAGLAVAFRRKRSKV